MCNLINDIKSITMEIVSKTIFSKSLANISAMSSEELINGSKNLYINYSFGMCPFGKLLIASTKKGICSVYLANDLQNAIESLNKKFPKAIIAEKQEPTHLNLLSVIDKKPITSDPIQLHLKGTDFQIKVWNSLLEIPFGETSTYGKISKAIGKQKACRAVGSAIGDNPIFYLIPCHRVILSTGTIGQYYWGTDVKKSILQWENENQFNNSAKDSGK